MKYFSILFISYITFCNGRNIRSPLHYYPFTNKHPPSTPTERLIHDLDVLVDQGQINKNETNSKN